MGQDGQVDLLSSLQNVLAEARAPLRLGEVDARQDAQGFSVGEEGSATDYIVRGGEVLVIPSNVPHLAEALEDTDNLDIFAPPRQDWLSGDDAYLRSK